MGSYHLAPEGKGAGHVAGPLKVLLAEVIRAFLFWNTGPLYATRAENGVFAYHSGMSAAERFIERMTAIGVLVWAGRQGYQVTIRYDAVDAYSSFLVDTGLPADDVVCAFVVLMIDGCISLLPGGKGAFEAKFYDNKNGTTSFDTRRMMAALVEMGYAEEADQKYIWSERMHSTIARAWAD